MTNTTRLNVMVLAAGKGTRMKSSIPKVCTPVLERTLIGWVIDALRVLPIERLCFVVGFEKDQVEKAVTSHLTKYAPELLERVVFAEQKDQLGTGHALQCGLSKMQLGDAPLLVSCGDTPLLGHKTLRALYQEHLQTEAHASMATSVVSNPFGYGRIMRVSDKITQIIEEKDASPAQKNISEVNPGLYIFNSAFLMNHASSLSSNNANMEFYITDLIEKAARCGTIGSVDMPEVEMLGINSQVQRAEAERLLLETTRAHWLEEGVKMEMPETIWIGPDVQLEAGVELEPHVRLSGQTIIRSGARISHGAILSDATVGSGTHILPYSHIEAATIEEHASIGPFARLREGSHIESSCKIGNFVETKKTRLRSGAKASHLSYLGDADIGSGSNIGAGTITCNYDGFGKHPTVLGERVFIGSNSTLIAPLNLANDAYVAAGSSISDDVPAGTLAIGRARQSLKEGYVEGLRQKLKDRKTK